MTVPELIWSGGVGALAGAVVALVTSWLNNRGQNRRQAQQLEHDIEQRTRQLQHDADQRKVQFEHDSAQQRIEREMSLRREVYLDATASIGDLQEFIASYARQDISESDKLAMVRGNTATLNKVHIVGTNRTIEAFSSAQLAFAKVSFRLSDIKIDIMKKSIDIDQLQRDLRLLEERREGALQLPRGLGFAPDPEAIEETRSKLLGLDGELEKVSDFLDQAQDELFGLQMALVKESALSILDMIDAFSKAVLAVREELRLDFDGDAYRAFMEVHRAQLKEEVQAFLQRTSTKAGDADE
jgi:hypothetical protein